MNMLKQTRPFLLFIALLLLTGCESFGGDEYRPDVTEILRVEVEPNPVAAGDTVTFTCVVTDSLRQDFKFLWSLPGIDTAVTDTSQYRWAAPSEPGDFHFQVRVATPENSSDHHVQKPFEVTVTE